MHFFWCLVLSLIILQAGPMLIIAVNKVYNMLGVIKSYADSCYVYTMEYSKVSSSKVRYLLVKYILSIT